MEPGQVGAESLYGGARWHRSRSVLAMGGEKIGEHRWDGMVRFEAVRCPGGRWFLARS